MITPNIFGKQKLCKTPPNILQGVTACVTAHLPLALRCFANNEAAGSAAAPQRAVAKSPCCQCGGCSNSDAKRWQSEGLSRPSRAKMTWETIEAETVRLRPSR